MAELSAGAQKVKLILEEGFHADRADIPPLVAMTDLLLEVTQASGATLSIKRTGEKTFAITLGGEAIALDDESASRLIRLFRPILARVAVLASETSTSPISPYGGAGEFQFGSDPALGFKLEFNNDTRKPYELNLTPATVTHVKERTTTHETEGPAL